MFGSTHSKCFLSISAVRKYVHAPHGDLNIWDFANAKINAWASWM